MLTKDEPIILTIQADGKPKPQVKWFKGNDEIPINQAGIKIIEEGDNTYKLIIEKSTEKDQGEYSAIIQNAGGQVKSKKTNVTVTSKLTISFNSLNFFIHLFRITGICYKTN